MPKLKIEAPAKFSQRPPRAKYFASSKRHNENPPIYTDFKPEQGQRVVWVDGIFRGGNKSNVPREIVEFLGWTFKDHEGNPDVAPDARPFPMTGRIDIAADGPWKGDLTFIPDECSAFDPNINQLKVMKDMCYGEWIKHGISLGYSRLYLIEE